MHLQPDAVFPQLPQPLRVQRVVSAGIQIIKCITRSQAGKLLGHKE
jgi:hypothetical protein